MSCWPWVLATDPQVISAWADVATAIAALLGASYLILDRHRPRSYLFAAWARSAPCFEPDATEVNLFAVTMMAEPVQLVRIEAAMGCEVALRLLEYSVERARRATMFPSMTSPSQVNWRRAVQFTQRPRIIGTPTPSGDYTPIATVFVRGAAAESETHLKLVFALTTDPRREVRKSVAVKVRYAKAPEQGES